ncbi:MULTISPECIES: thermonuclease family protein [unclassified Sedimentibacter]|uniref:thermonuclease family protein n=1 Tax=unclassified Sedimentibacter TaxID=2649220 RepID=UPI0027E2067B|nr:thermonuclease family protein [Sedimentibacter sp. MB35-C1]WMJ78737.1 thermonuclease family protein [Sedimentibacter sp. MB35-C1]
MKKVLQYVGLILIVYMIIVNARAYFVGESLETNSDSNKYKVIRVVDGDTFEINFDGKKEKVRLIGVDTPESVHPDANRNVEEGKLTSEYTKKYLEGKEVTLEFDVQERDKYGRLLAYVWLNGEMYNKHLLNIGYAQVATYPPNVRYVDEFTALQEVARDNKVGLWEATANEEPNLAEYIGNTNSKKFHRPDCSSVEKMSKNNKIIFNSRTEAIDQGYGPCGICKP